MARFTFPISPQSNQQVQLGARTFTWDGTRWRFIPPAITAVKQEDVNTAVQTSTTSLVGSAPQDLDTLEKIADAINNDADFHQTMTNALDLKLDESSYTANDVLSKLLTVDGPSSEIDADTLDGQHASAFLTSLPTHDHDDLYYTETEVNNLLDDKADLVNGLVPANQLPSYVDDVLEFADLDAFPNTGETGKIYVALDSNKIYRWSGSAYVEISQGAIANDGTLTVASGTGLSGSGTFSADQSTNETITLSHADTSTQTSVDNSNNENFIKSLTIDEFGHVTAITSDEVAAGSVSQSFTATIGSSNWTGTDPFVQTISVPGLLSTDNPVIDITFANNYNTDLARAIEWSKIYRISTQDDEITVSAALQPLVDLPIQIIVVR